MAPCRRVAHRIDKVLKRQNRRMRRWLFRLWLLYVILRFLVRRKVARVWKKCKNRGAYYFERMKNAYIKAVLFIYRCAPFMRVSAVVIFLHLFMSGDVELHPGPQDQLTIGDLKTVKKAVWSARTKWKDIGLELDIIQTDLDAIEAEHRSDIGRCLIEMLALWLKQVDPPPTWSTMVAALQDPTIEEGALAKQVESKYVHQCSKTVTSDITDSDPATKSQEVSSTRNLTKLEEYAEELKSCYKAKTYTSDDDDDIQWPPPVDDKHKIFRLEIVEAKRRIRRSEVDSAWARCKTIDDKVDEVVRQRGPIELQDIFKKLESQMKVLLEGAPGCGKSTLSFHVCHQWADGKLFQEYKLVVLIRLRDSIAQDATSIDTLLQDAVGDVAEEIKASKGKDILLVLDGWDELAKVKPGHTVILDLIKSKTLSQSSIIITSRPTSSANLHKYVSLRAEILGFSKSELRSYFEFCLEDEPIGKDVGDLLKRIENNPIIEGICYLPLNASILVHLFICGRGELPNTQYGIFSDLICNCIYRYLKKSGVDAAEIDSLDELPQSIDSQFQELCELAYDGVMNDEVIFHLKSKPGFVTLDLLQKVESFGRRGGMSYSFNFLHLSIQELLAAYHIATKLTDDDQAEKFKEMYNNPRFSAVFQFYAAITKLKTPEIKDVVVQVAKGCAVDRPNRTDKALLLSLLHCLYEAQDSSLCKLVADQLESKLNLYVYGTTLSLAECFSLQYFLKHLENFDVDLRECSIDGDKCKALFKPDQVYPIKSLDIGRNSIETKGAVSIAEAMGKTPNLQQFKLGLRGIGREAALCVLTAMKTMATLPCMDLGSNSLGEDGAAALCEILKTMSNLHYLDLSNNEISSEGGVALSEALRGMTNLQHLNLEDNEIGSEGGVALSEALRGMTNLQHLNLWGNAIGTEAVVALSVAMETMTNLQYLDLGANGIDDEGAVAISSPLMKMSSLQELVFGGEESRCSHEGAMMVLAAIRTMSNMKTLVFRDLPLGDDGAKAVLEAVKVMPNLQNLFVDNEGTSISEVGEQALEEAMELVEARSEN